MKKAIVVATMLAAFSFSAFANSNLVYNGDYGHGINEFTQFVDTYSLERNHGDVEIVVARKFNFAQSMRGGLTYTHEYILYRISCLADHGAGTAATMHVIYTRGDDEVYDAQIDGQPRRVQYGTAIAAIHDLVCQ